MKKMTEEKKNRLILILSTLTILFVISGIGSCVDSRNQRLDRNKEMALRIELEENMTKLSGANRTLEAKVKELETTLLKNQDLIKRLKEELEKTSKLKDTLEDDLKDALVR